MRSDDFFEDTSDDFSSDSHTGDILDPVGASPMENPSSPLGANGRKGLLKILIPILLLGGIVYFATGGDEEQAETQEVPKGMVVAEKPKSDSLSLQELEAEAAQKLQEAANTHDNLTTQIEQQLQDTSLVHRKQHTPLEIGSEANSASSSNLAEWMPTPVAESTTQPSQQIEQPTLSLEDAALPDAPPLDGSTATQREGSSDFQADAAYIAKRNREIEAEKKKAALEEWKKEQRERLRKRTSTRIDQKDQEGGNSPAPAAAGPSRFGANGEFRAMLEQTMGADGASAVLGALDQAEGNATETSPATAGGDAPAAGRSGIDLFGILPGTRVSAITTTEFIADQDGSGAVEARLTTSLRSKDGRTILPAGTRAFGQARASENSAGGARVAITFSVFVTPQGRIYRENLSAKAADPETFAMSVKAKTDHRFIKRVVSGLAATAIDYAMTSSDDAKNRRSIYEEKSPREEVEERTRERAGAMLTETIGADRGNISTVKLPHNTAVTLVFGM